MTPLTPKTSKVVKYPLCKKEDTVNHLPNTHILPLYKTVPNPPPKICSKKLEDLK